MGSVTPAVLSGQMEPPPIVPVAELNFAADEFKINDVATGLTADSLVRNATGAAPSTLLVPGRGIPLHWDASRSSEGFWPPSLVGTPELIALVQPLLNEGRLTVVCEFDNEYLPDNTDDVPLLSIFNSDPFVTEYPEDFGEIDLASVEVFTDPPGYLFETYAYGHPTTSFNGYMGGSPTAMAQRRYRVAATWGHDRGTGVGVNRYQGGVSVNGTPQFVAVSFGETPTYVNYDLSYFGPIHSIHIGGVGFDMATDPNGDLGWWYWPPEGFWLRYIAFYRGKNIIHLPNLSRQAYQKVHVSQFYAEVIHDPVV